MASARSKTAHARSLHMHGVRTMLEFSRGHKGLNKFGDMSVLSIPGTYTSGAHATANWLVTSRRHSGPCLFLKPTIENVVNHKREHSPEDPLALQRV